MHKEKQEEAVQRRKEVYDRGKGNRQFKVGDLVLLRVPVMDLKLQDAWKGPYEVVERLGEVNYRIEDVE